MSLPDLHIERDEYTPLIQYLPEEARLVLEGKSISEDPMAFFAPLFEWQKKYIENPIPLTLYFNLDYFNTASSKMIFSFAKRMNEGSIKPNYIWRHLDEDEDLQEYGEYLQENIGGNFVLESYED